MFTYSIDSSTKIITIVDPNGNEIDKIGPWSHLEGLDLWASQYINQVNDYGSYPILQTEE